jgi:L-ascorbate metabolism protein UlaG (beta-lactamase superfamily)
VTDRITWLGHATTLVEAAGTRLLTDPLLGARLLHLRRHGPSPAVPARIDAVLLSHLHHDHADAASLRALPRGTPVVVPRGAGAVVGRLVRGEVTELAPGEHLRIGGATVEAVPAVHDGGRGPLLGRGAQAMGYVIAGDARTYFAGDTEVFDGMRAIAAGGLDAALLPVWGWGPSLGDGHMDPEQAAQAAGARVRRGRRPHRARRRGRGAPAGRVGGRPVS